MGHDAGEHAPSTGRYALHLGVFVAGYFLCAALANWMSVGAGETLVFWLPSGFCLAALLWRHPRQWPWFLGAALICNAVIDLVYGKPVVTSTLVSLGNVAESVCGAWLVRRRTGRRPDLSKPADLVALAMYAGLLAPVVSATVGTLAMRGLHPGVGDLSLWFSWWLGSVMGVIVVAPAILCFGVPAPALAARRGWPAVVEGLMVLTLTAFLAGETSRIEAAGATSIRFLLFPVIGWAAFRFGSRGAALATVVAAMAAAWSLREAVGRGVEPHQGWPGLWLGVHGGMIIAGFTGLLLASLFADGRRRETELRANRQRLESILDACPLALIAVDREGRVCLWNPAATALLGWSSDEVVGRLPPFVPAEELDKFRARLDGLLAGETYQGIDRRYRKKDGAHADTKLWTVPLRDADGSIHSTLALVLDVTQLHRTQEALRESSRRFDSLIESTQAGYFFVDRDGRFRQVNRAWLRMHGFDSPEEILGKPFRVTQTADGLGHAESVIRRMLTGEAGVSGECERRHRDGTVGHHMFSLNAVVEGGVIVGVEGVLIDTTERRRLEERLSQAQRLEAIGQLAGGVAHDFNNILAATLIHLGMLKTDPGMNRGARDTVVELEADVRRGADLVRQLLAFGRRSMLVRKAVDLNQVIGGMRRMLERLVGPHVRCDVALADRLPAIEADASMMEQVIMNLAVNARDAMSSGGHLSLVTQSVTARASVEGEEPGPPRPCVCLEVTDTGCGMDEATRRRIFEPFFTTKDVGQGTGLGLSTVYGIVRQHQGWIEVTSQLEKGSTFRVYLPSITEPAPVAAEVSVVPATTGGTETLLVVEDDEQLRRLLAASLRRGGYQVIEASAGRAAIDLWRERSGQIDLVFTDVVMPDGMSGADLARLLRREDPDLPVILSSGYSAELVNEDMSLQEGVVFVQKPLDLAQLHDAVRRALETRVKTA